MFDSIGNRAARRGKTRRAKTAALAGTAAAAMTFGLAASATAPEAHAIDANWDPLYTSGAIAAVLNWFGDTFPGRSISIYDSGPPRP